MSKDFEPSLDEMFVGLEGVPRYAVSNYGRVINVRTGKELPIKADKDGELRVVLSYKGTKYRVFVKRLVAQMFFLNYKHGVGVNFINGDKTDCSVLNLTLMKSVRR